jgi:hypothetical protein
MELSPTLLFDPAGVFEHPFALVQAGVFQDHPEEIYGGSGYFLFGPPEQVFKGYPEFLGF